MSNQEKFLDFSYPWYDQLLRNLKEWMNGLTNQCAISLCLLCHYKWIDIRLIFGLFFGLGTFWNWSSFIHSGFWKTMCKQKILCTCFIPITFMKNFFPGLVSDVAVCTYFYLCNLSWICQNILFIVPCVFLWATYSWRRCYI